VDDDVECLHVERNPTMTCSGSHLYKFYRLRCSLLSFILLKEKSLWWGCSVGYFLILIKNFKILKTIYMFCVCHVN
jgi:hypothetical protein